MVRRAAKCKRRREVTPGLTEDMTVKNLSIIIPLGPDEDQLCDLLDDLRLLPDETEIIAVPCNGNIAQQVRIAEDHPLRDRLLIVSSTQGRAVQQNAGAAAASRDFLWFLHADSRVTPDALRALEAALAKAPDALHYFHLKFKNDGPGSMWINEWGVRFRSRILGIPFGDQGFCLHRKCFSRIGRFPEDASYGEDHLLVWHARQSGVKVRCTNADLTTSARKYGRHGWASLTMKYQYLWIRQAMPELGKLIRLNLSGESPSK